jgi:hypothetical protein
VVRAATREHAINVDIDLSSIPYFEGLGSRSGRRTQRRMTGWI